MPSASPSSAAGTSAGFVYQFERALYHLSQGDAGTVVFIEAASDVVAEQRIGPETHEEDKNRTSDAIPYGNRAPSLWKTLHNWIEDVQKERINPDNTRFLLATNKQVPKSYIVWALSEAESDKEVRAAVDKLIEVGRNPSKTISRYYATVTSARGKTLEQVVRLLKIDDGTDGPDLRAQIASGFRIPDTVDSDEIFKAVDGWIVTSSKRAWEKGETAKVTGLKCNRVVSRAIANELGDVTIREAAQITDPTPDELPDNPLFVQQIRKLGASKKSEEKWVADALIDWFKAEKEATNLAEQADVLPSDISHFQEALYRHWESTFFDLLSDPDSGDCSEKELQRIGRQIFSDTRKYTGDLPGVKYTRRYLSEGYYHKLANMLRLGWHPSWKALFAPDTENWSWSCPDLVEVSSLESVSNQKRPSCPEHAAPTRKSFATASSNSPAPDAQ